MTYQNDDRTAVVKHIQQLLRTLQIYGDKNVTVPVDGLYMESTYDAVLEFQKENGLAPTGEVDKATYDLLYAHALEAEFEDSEPLPLYVLGKGQSVSKGEKSDTVMIIQAILNTLTVAYDDYSPLALNGVFDNQTEDAVRRFQMRNGIDASGIVDKRTWNALIRNYNKHIEIV